MTVRQSIICKLMQSHNSNVHFGIQPPKALMGWSLSQRLNLKSQLTIIGKYNENSYCKYERNSRPFRYKYY